MQDWLSSRTSSLISKLARTRLSRDRQNGEQFVPEIPSTEEVLIFVGY